MTIITAGSTTPSITIEVYDDSGLPVTGLVAATLPTIRYVIEGPNSATSITLADLAAETTAYSSGGVKERAGSAGRYRLDLPTASVATAGTRVKVYGEASGKRVVCEPIDVTPYAGVNWAAVLNPTTTVGLSGTTVGGATSVTALGGGAISLSTLAATILQLLGPELAVVTGTVSPAADGTYGCTNGTTITNGKPALMTSGGTFYIWWSSADNYWVLSVSQGSKGTNWWRSSTTDRYGAWQAGGGSTSGTPVVSALRAQCDTSGRAFADLRSILGSLITGTASQIVAAFTTFFDVATARRTCSGYDQTGDTFTRIGSAGAGLTSIGDTRLANLDAAVSSRSTLGGTAQTGDAYARLGAPVGASISADIASTKTSADSAATNASSAASSASSASSGISTLAAKFSGITLVKNWLAIIMGKTDDSGTLAEVNATTAGATYNNTTDSLEKLQEAGSGGTSGSGANTVTITVQNASNVAVPNANVSAWSGSTLVATGTTNASGVATLALNNGTYTINITASGFNGSSFSLAVSGSTPHTQNLTAITITPSEPPAVTGYLYCYDQSGNPQAGVVHTLTQIGAEHGSTGVSFSKTPITAQSDSNGLVQFTNLIVGASYNIQRNGGSQVKFTVGDSNFELPACLG